MVTLAFEDSTVRNLPIDGTPVIFRIASDTAVETMVYVRTIGGPTACEFWSEAGVNYASSVLPELTGTLLGAGQWVGPMQFAAGVGYRATCRAAGITAPPTPRSLILFVYRINRLPEGVPQGLALGTEVTEVLETPHDIDEFLLEGKAGEAWVAFFAYQDPPSDSVTGDLRALIPHPVTGEWPPVLTVSHSTLQLDDNASATALLPADGTYRLRVRAPLLLSGARRPYRLKVVRVNRHPETARTIFAIGDSIHEETLDHIGDIDEFTVAGAPGQLFNVFTSFRDGTGNTLPWPLRLALSAFGTDAPELFRGREFATHTNTGRLQMPAGGEVRLRVAGVSNKADERVNYRLRLQPIDPRPEGIGGTLAPGETAAEQISPLGDLDEYVLTAASARTVNVVLSRDATSDIQAGSLSVLRDDGSLFTPLLELPGEALARGTGRLRLAAGASYRLQVSGLPAHTWRTLGPYRLRVYEIDEATESAGPEMQIDVPSSDAIEPFGDLDTLVYAATAGDVVRLRVTVPGSAAASGIGAILMNPAPFDPAAPAASWWAIATPTGDTGPRELTESRNYTVRVAAGEGIDELGDRGAYSVRLERVSTAPETAASTLVPGASVGESIAPYDVDEYRVVGAPNAEVSVVLSLPGATSFEPHCADVLAAASPARVGSILSSGEPRGSGIISLGTAGEVRVRLWSRPDNASSACTTLPLGRAGGPNGIPQYRLDVHAVNRAPEVAPAAVAVGDTARGEGIDHPGDVDQFTFGGVAGQVVRPALRETPPLLTLAGSIRMQVVDPLGAVVAEHSTGGLGNAWVSGAAIALARTGTYQVRFVVREQSGDDRAGPAGYEFALTP